MSQRGVWQLKKLVVSYCNWGGSSRGVSMVTNLYANNVWISEEFMESKLPAFKEINPQLEVETKHIGGQHPHLEGIYRNKNERTVCVRNMTPEEVLECAIKLRNSLGRKVVKLKTRHVTKHPSVQGTWTTALKL